jgi:hypothetical protein
VPVSRGRKKQPKKSQQNLSQNRQPLPGKPPKSVWDRVRDHPVPWIIGLFAAVLAVGEPLRQALLAPEISVDSAIVPSKPFAFPFIVKNESWLFAMRRTNLLCGVASVRWRGGGGIEGPTIIDSKRADIAPGNSALFKCSIGMDAASEPGFQLTAGHLSISVTYQTAWWFNRQSPKTDFTWLTDGDPPHWAKGIPAVFTP